MTDNSTLPVRGQIVVGVDGSEPSKRALRWAAFMAKATGSEILAVTAWQPYATYGYAGIGWTPVTGELDPAGLAEKILAQTLDDVFGPDRPAHLELATPEGNPARVILDAGHGARMIVVGSRGHGGFAGLLLGSVSAACTEHAGCPVLVIHGDTEPPPA